MACANSHDGTSRYRDDAAGASGAFGYTPHNSLFEAGPAGRPRAPSGPRHQQVNLLVAALRVRHSGMQPSKRPETASPKKEIFVISPIGKPDESGFDFSDLVLDEIVKPAALDVPGFGIPERADEVQAPGSITSRIVQAIVDADVCIADLTGRNPNVMYEVAIAHAADKPVILLQQEPGGPPFDFTAERVIHYGTRADLANGARRQLAEFLRNANQDEQNELLAKTMHPVRLIFKELQTRATATEPQQEILKHLDTITQSIEKLEVERDIPIGNKSGSRRISDKERSYLRLSESSAVWRLTEEVAKIAGEPAAKMLASRIREGLITKENIEAVSQFVEEAEGGHGVKPNKSKDVASNLADYIAGIPPF